MKLSSSPADYGCKHAARPYRLSVSDCIANHRDLLEFVGGIKVSMVLEMMHDR
jgi:hypothetical protein